MLRPTQSPDELFHQAISTFLLEWAEARRVSPHTVHVVGESWSGRAYELREVLERCAMPHTFCLADSPEGRELLDGGRATATPLPIVVFPDGRVLADPTQRRDRARPPEPRRPRASATSTSSSSAPARPACRRRSTAPPRACGTLVVDEGGIGGQATSSSLIRNYLGFPRGVSGRRLAEQAYEQAWVFGAKFAFMHDVDRPPARRRPAPRRALRRRRRSARRAVILATGATYRRLGVAGSRR